VVDHLGRHPVEQLRRCRRHLGPHPAHPTRSGGQRQPRIVDFGVSRYTFACGRERESMQSGMPEDEIIVEIQRVGDSLRVGH